MPGGWLVVGASVVRWICRQITRACSLQNTSFELGAVHLKPRVSRLLRTARRLAPGQRNKVTIGAGWCALILQGKNRFFCHGHRL
jgi:hypothetical protein